MNERNLRISTPGKKIKVGITDTLEWDEATSRRLRGGREPVVIDTTQGIPVPAEQKNKKEPKKELVKK